jgi:hypothetical protein
MFNLNTFLGIVIMALIITRVLILPKLIHDPIKLKKVGLSVFKVWFSLLIVQIILKFTTG